jgi:sarcosine oxidase, subunit gamma
MHSRVLDPCPIVRVQSWDATASATSALDEVVGVKWPREVGSVATGIVGVLCLGPTEWLVIGVEPDGVELGAKLGAAVVGSPFRATDMSRALARVELSAHDVREFLLKGCSLDLRPDRFPAGRCARTRFAGVPAILRCRDSSRFEGIVATSYREYLLAWIADANR